jgi:transcription antitermination factor NusG
MLNGQANEPKAWFALQVRSRWENTAKGLLENKGFETLLPTYPATRRWSDRSKIVESPLFPGYVFCRFEIHDRLPILITPGVISVVGRGKTPVAVAESEITALQMVIRSGIQTHPWPYLEIGERVRVKNNALEGMEGILTSFKGRQRVIISVALLQRSVALEIDRSRILRLNPARATPADAVVSLPRLGDVVA